MSLIRPLIPATILFTIGIFQPWEKTGDILFFILSVLCLGIGFIYMKKNINEHTKMKQASVIQQLIRHQRHDLLNHVQVLMGYQMMNHSKKIANYLQKIIQQTNNERKITDFDYPPLSAMILMIQYDYPEWDWQLVVEDNFSFQNIEQEKQCDQLLRKVLPCFVQEASKEKNWVQIQLRFSQLNGQIMISFACMAEEGEQTDHTLEVKEIASKLDQWSAVCRWSKAEQQLMIKMTA